MANISKDIAQSSPDLFVKTLVDKATQNPRLQPILNGLQAIGQFSQNAVILSNGCACETTGDNPAITLGFKEIPLEVQNEVFYTASLACPRGYENQLLYRFNHEVLHKYIDVLLFQGQHPKMTELLEIATQAREEGKLGLSSYGKLVHTETKGALKQANEDVTELLNMYVWHPQYLKDYLDLLASPNTEQLRKKHGLVGLTHESKDYIYQLVQSIITTPQK